jgi:hypothetical protein
VQHRKRHPGGQCREQTCPPQLRHNSKHRLTRSRVRSIVAFPVFGQQPPARKASAVLPAGSGKLHRG